MANYQTISEFLRTPFGNSGDIQKLSKYNNLYNTNSSKIILNAHTKIENSYYFHVKVPSESQKDGNIYYDVVIRFFTDKPSNAISTHIRDYYIQFFSNSPGFIYNYAVLYRKNGFLIDSLYTKMDPRYFDKLPEKSNPKMELSYDKTIYFACRFLNDRKFKVLNKIGIPLGKRLSPDKFFKEIKDFQSVKMENELLTLERRSLKGLEKTLTKVDSENKKPIDTHRKTASTSTTVDKRNPRISKKTAAKTTSVVKSIVKKTAGKSTRKN